MRYTIYKITNLINGKVYIGKHQTTNPLDSYYGSGRALVNAIKKYGKSNFEKVILFDFDNEEEMNMKEKELVSEDFVSSSETYNLGVGGEGGAHFKGRKHSEGSLKKMRENMIGFSHSDETKNKISDINKERFSDYKNREIISNSMKGHVLSDETKNKISNSLKGKERSEETKKKISDTMKQRKIIQLRDSVMVKSQPHKLENG